MAGFPSRGRLRHLQRTNRQVRPYAEQAFALADEDSPAYLPGAFELALGSLAAVPRIAESFRTGAGMGWHEHVDGVFHGCEKFFRPGYAANLVSSWIPAVARRAR